VIINIPDELFPRLSANAIKVLGYYQQMEQPITEGAKVTAQKIQMSVAAIDIARIELVERGLVQVNRPKKTSVEILLINY